MLPNEFCSLEGHGGTTAGAGEGTYTEFPAIQTVGCLFEIVSLITSTEKGKLSRAFVFL